MTARDTELRDLLVRVARGDGDALTAFYDASRVPLSAFVRRLVRDAWDADEVVQDVYRQVWLGAASYSPERSVPMAWLYMLPRSRALDCLRRAKRQPAMTAEWMEGLASFECRERPQVERFEAGLVRRAVVQLPEEQRRFIEWAFVDGYSHSEIASRTGIPLGTVKGRIRAALGKIRQLLGRPLRFRGRGWFRGGRVRLSPGGGRRNVRSRAPMQLEQRDLLRR